MIAKRNPCSVRLSLAQSQIPRQYGSTSARPSTAFREFNHCRKSDCPRYFPPNSIRSWARSFLHNDANAAVQVRDAAELEAAVRRLLADESERRRPGAAARDLVRCQQGATGRTI